MWEAVEPLRDGASVEDVAHGGGDLARGELTGVTLGGYIARIPAEMGCVLKLWTK